MSSFCPRYSMDTMYSLERYGMKSKSLENEIDAMHFSVVISAIVNEYFSNDPRVQAVKAR